MSFNIEIESGSSVRLPTSGKYCDRDIIITATGGGFAPVVEKDVNFYDYDGTLLHSYTLAEAMQMNELPSLPEHDGLTCQGWNWTLADIRDLEHTLGADIGAVYITTDGKTHCYFEFVDEKKLDVTLNFTGTLDIDWGDGTTTSGATSPVSHSYASTGVYLAKLYSASAYKIGGGTSALTFVTGNAHALKKLHLASNATLHSSGYALYNMRGLETATIHTSALSTSGMNSCYGLQCIVLADRWALGTSALSNNTALRVVCPTPSAYLQNQCLRGCSSLRRFLVGKGAYFGDGYHFYGCYSMREAYLCKVNSYECHSTYALRRVILKNDITQIATNAFYNSAVETLRLPASVTNIDASAFANCAYLVYLEFNSATPPTVANANAFTGVPKTCIVKVPDLATYQAATNYGTIAAQMVEG